MWFQHHGPQPSLAQTARHSTSPLGLRSLPCHSCQGWGHLILCQLLYICGFPHRLILCPGQLARPHTPCSCPVASHTYPLDIIVPHIIPAPTAPAHRWLSPPSPIPAPRPCWEYFPKTLTTTSFPLFSPHVTPRQKPPMTRDLVRALCCCSLGAQYRPAPGHCSGDGGFPLCSCPLGGLVHGHSVGSFPQKGVGMLLVG